VPSLEAEKLKHQSQTGYMQSTCSYKRAMRYFVLK